MDIIVVVTLLGIVMPLMIPVNLYWNNHNSSHTLVGITAFYTKLSAINNHVETQLVIHNQQLNAKYPVPFDNCRIRFSPNGTSRESDSCHGINHTLTLRPGEGGIGYPW